MQIDVLVKNEKHVKLKKNIGRIFRQYNIIEYKSPEDGSGTGRQRHILPHRDAIPIQLVIVQKLSKEHNYWLNNLRNDLKAGSEIKKITESGTTTLQTGGRQIDYNAYIKRLETIDMEYENIRIDTTDISKIAQNTGMPEWKISRIKDHVFSNEHILDAGVKRFDADPEIADAWYRLTNGTYNQNDIDLLNHEYFESKFESFYKTDYRTTHNKTEESGRIWDPYKENN